MPTLSTCITPTECKLFEGYKELIKKDGRIMFLGELLKRANELYGTDTALIFQDTFMSYKELYFRSILFSRVLADAEVKEGDRVLLFFENSIMFYIAYFAILQLGAIVAPLNVFLTERELEHIITDAHPSLIVTSNELAKIVEKTNVDKPPVITQDAIDMTTPVPETVPEITIPQKDPHELAVLLYTSGTTGFPKGVMLSSANALINTVQGLTRIEFDRQARVFCVLPLFHSFAQYACVWASILRGCTIILVPKIDRRAILKALNHKPDIFLGVPALYGLLCLLKTAPLESVRYFVSGGDALPDKIRGAFELIYNRKICNGYGLTETSPLIAFDADDLLEPTSTVGRPVIDVAVLLRDENGNEVSRGTVGQLWVKGPNVMLGYYNEPEKTAEVLKDGWLDTGDLAYLDRRGKLVISGRVKDLIINKGLNIYPQEIENIILSHTNVVRVGVIGKKDEASGEVPIACVQLRVQKERIEKELLELCKKNLAAYKVPREFICSIDELPLTATSKVDKKKLRAQYANG